MRHKLAFVGFGTVGQGLAEILLNKNDELRARYGAKFEVVAICDAIKGSIYHPRGLNMQMVLDVMKATGSLNAYPQAPGLVRGLSSIQTIRETNAETIVEVTYTNVKTGQPAIDHCRAAFEFRKNVVTSNKGPAALAFAELSHLAKEMEVHWGIEGTVMSGTPTLLMPLVSLAGNDITEIRGILNGTTNYILTRMEQGLSYELALAEAQKFGYAEADPTSDVDGFDAMYKILILANVVMKEPLLPSDVDRHGITEITIEDMNRASAEGKRWKLMARIQKSQGKVNASVRPELVPLHDPLAGVMGTTNAVTYQCDLIGPVTVVGAGAGRTETGFSLLIDLIHIVRQQSKLPLALV